MLRTDNSELMLDYGFTQDDVDWEARFTGPEGNGFVLRFRPDLPARRRHPRRRGRGRTAGGRAGDAGDHLVVSGTAQADEPVWANEPIWDPLLGEPAGSTYARRGCIPVKDALGSAADAEHLAAVDAAHPVHILDDLPAFSIGFGDHLATVRMEENREDLFTRLDVGRDWPTRTSRQTFRDAGRRPDHRPDRLRPAAAAGRRVADAARGAAVRDLQRAAAGGGADRPLA